jgi:DNA-binding IclR family transcriptional regulator
MSKDLSNEPKSAERGSDRTYAAPALEKGFDIVELLSTAPEGLTVRDIALRLDRSISEVFRVIMVMERRNWLRKDPENDRYRVTYHVLDSVQRATPAQALGEVAKPIMVELAAQTNQSCHLVVRSDGHGLVVQRQESPGPAGFAMRMGATIDLVTSCSGHVLLAFLEEERLEAALAIAPAPLRVPKARLLERLRQVRSRGYETQASVRTAGVTDSSFPIFGYDGRVMAALTIPYLLLIDGSQTVPLDLARERLRVASARISHGLGWSS